MSSSKNTDPLHRLHSTPTKATKNHRWDVSREAETIRTKKITQWGIDEDARVKARRIAAKPPPSVATRGTPTKKTARHSLSGPTAAGLANIIRSASSSKKKHQSSGASMTPTKNASATRRRSSDKTDDPLHRLHSTPTKATNNQRWDVSRNMEKAFPPSSPTATMTNIIRSASKKHPSSSTPTKNASATRRISSGKSADPLHRLHSTPTKATNRQRWDVSRDMEKTRVKEMVQWGVDRAEVRRLAAKAPPSVANRPRTTPSKTTRRSTPKKKNMTNRNSGPPKLVVCQTPNILYPDVEEIEAVCFDIDESKTGKLSMSDIDKAVTLLYPGFENKAAFAAAYKTTDLTRNGFITHRQVPFFLHYLVYHNNLRPLFFKADEDERGISRIEFLAAATTNMDLEEDPNKVFNNVIGNDEDIISFDELCLHLAFSKSGGSDENIRIEEQTTALANDKEEDAAPNALLDTKMEDKELLDIQLDSGDEKKNLPNDITDPEVEKDVANEADGTMVGDKEIALPKQIKEFEVEENVSDISLGSDNAESFQEAPCSGTAAY
mmetsp:Transcript_24741/g.37359  ORF Transcript_24741/g.37359 Transcript_24741/m.37359 type:complete len:551 (-) Transcript_24741:87-1739(-)